MVDSRRSISVDLRSRRGGRPISAKVGCLDPELSKIRTGIFAPFLARPPFAPGGLHGQAILKVRQIMPIRYIIS